MKIIIASNPFKGSLTLKQVGNCIERGFRDALPRVKVEHIPIADGGDGTLDAVRAVAACRTVRKKVSDPLGRPVKAEYLLLDSEPTAVVEMAQASGLTLLKSGERNPMVATTFGTGELLRDAVTRGACNVIIGIGGSATNDGGTGVARAFGYRFLDARGVELPQGGGALLKLTRIVPPEKILPRGVRFTVASDVQNPLLGPKGASRVYSPQKGADPAMVRELEKAMKRLADVAERDLGVDRRDTPGAGSAGGLGFGLMTFFGAKMQSGIQLIIKISGFERRIRGADLVITGEGFMDAQSIQGKAPMGVLAAAKKHRVPVIAFCGGVSDEEELYRHGFTAVIPIAPGPITTEEAMRRGEELLYRAAYRTARMTSFRNAGRA